MHSLTQFLEFMLLDRRDEWLAARLEDLDYDGIEAAVRKYPLVEGVKKNEVEKELGYFLNNAPRMRYHWFRGRGLFVGSGVVEASCKTIVGQRLKQAGMHWTVNGADAEALEKAGIVFVCQDSYCGNDKMKDRLKKEGHEMLLKYHDYDVPYLPSAPDFEQMKKQPLYKKYSETELKEAFDRDLAKYSEQKAEYENKIATGAYILAFCVEGDKKGNYYYIEIKKSEKKGSSKDFNLETADLKAIQYEIERIETREKRSKELDANKVHERIIKALKEDKELEKLPEAFTPTDRAIMVFLIQKQISYHSRDKIKKITGISIGYDMENNPEKNYNLLYNLQWKSWPL